MVTIEELLPYIETYLIALKNTRYVDEQELFAEAGAMCLQHANRLAALDPDRNK